MPQVGLPQPASEEVHKLLQEVEALKAGQQAIRKELQESKKLLSGRGAERSPIRDINTTRTLADAFAKGDMQVPLTLVEFTDYQCPFCGRHIRETFPR
jgi:protein-disulfide isomerase